jgi:hypothetical protein
MIFKSENGFFELKFAFFVSGNDFQKHGIKGFKFVIGF